TFTVRPRVPWVNLRNILCIVCLPPGPSLSPKILPRRKHPPPQNLRPTSPPDLLRPVHPSPLAQSQKMPRPLIRRQSQIIQTKQHHPRRPLRPRQRRLPRQRKIRHPIFHLRPHVRPPLVFRLHLHIQRGDSPLRLHHLPRPSIHFPANIKRHLRLDAHLPLRSLFLYLLNLLNALSLLTPSICTPTPPPPSLPPASFSPPPIPRTPPFANAATAPKCSLADTWSSPPTPPTSSTTRTARPFSTTRAGSPSAAASCGEPLAWQPAEESGHHPHASIPGSFPTSSTNFGSSSSKSSSHALRSGSS